MKDLIINSLEVLCKISVVAIIAVGTGIGIATGNPFVAFAGLILSFVTSVVVFGVIFLLIDINDNLRKLRYLVEKNSEKT